MAAGNGKRMKSCTPKVLHLFKETPMLIRILLEALKLKPNKIIVITGKYDLLIKSTLKTYFENYKINSDIFDKIIFVKQTNPNGTGDAIKCALDYFTDDDKVLILNGDTPLLSFNLLKKFLEDIDLVLAKLLVSQLDNPFGYGRIIFDSKNNFIEIKEEKDCSEDEKKINIINAGIYLFSSSVLKKYIPLIDNNNNQNEYYLTDIIKKIKDNDLDLKINTFLIKDELKYQIQGVNTPEELKLLEESYV
jgi:bifunctional N-acetylglucosamine-1-phosphate-uridyltransferase/glucosamine-1-phosphate-acetyltransferase GlmU-like protein